MKNYWPIYTFVLAFLGSSCAQNLPDFRRFDDPRDKPEYKALLSSGANIDFFECPPITFKKGRPRLGEDLPASIEDYPIDGSQLLFECLALQANTPLIRFEINGFSEPSECENACLDLSFRRAELVKKALLDMHLPTKKIVCTVGHGENYIVDPNVPRRNRRVEINLNMEDRPDLNRNCKV